MTGRCLAAVLTVIALVPLAPAIAAGQRLPASDVRAAASDPPRTAWGDPDLQGIWNNNTSTPLERPDEFADKAILTGEELAAYTARRQASREDRDSRDGRGTDADVRRAYNAYWFPVPGKRSAARRLSWILRMGRFRP